MRIVIADDAVLLSEGAARLLYVREPKARALLDELVADGLLVRTGNGLYRRVLR